MAVKNPARLARRLFLIGMLIAVAVLLGRAPLPVVQASISPQAEEQARGEGANRAALVIRYQDGSVQTRCVAFPEAEIRGDELLERSGLAPGISSEGTVCSISGLGCPSDDCFCKCPFPECEYWAYYHWRNGAWSYSSIGAASYRVSSGALEGWSWGQGNFLQGVEPPAIAYEQICLDVQGASEASLPSPTDPSGSQAAAMDPAGPTTNSGAAWQLTESRSFSPSLLPGYAAYMLALTILIVIGWYVLHRKNKNGAAYVRELASNDRWLSREVYGRGHE